MTRSKWPLRTRCRNGRKVHGACARSYTMISSSHRWCSSTALDLGSTAHAMCASGHAWRMRPSNGNARTTSPIAPISTISTRRGGGANCGTMASGEDILRMVETGFQLQRTMITTRTGAAKGVRAMVQSWFQWGGPPCPPFPEGCGTPSGNLSARDKVGHSSVGVGADARASMAGTRPAPLQKP